MDDTCSYWCSIQYEHFRLFRIHISDAFIDRLSRKEKRNEFLRTLVRFFINIIMYYYWSRWIAW